MRNTNFLFLVLILTACGGGGGGSSEPLPPDATPRAKLGDIVPFATEEQRASFARGKALAQKRFTAADGHGPEFNVDSCAACHEKPVTGGAGGRYRNFLLVGNRNSGNGAFDPTGTNGIQPQFTLGAESRSASDPATNVQATRSPIPFFGSGLLAEISVQEIVSREDPNDSDLDGISGRVGLDATSGGIGRFGRKAQSASVESFIRGPLFNHLGITTDPLPAARRSQLPGAVNTAAAPSALQQLASWLLGIGEAIAQAGQPDQPTVDNDGIPDPELPEQDLFDLVSFALLLAPPAADPPTELTRAGESRFLELGCGGCHTPALQGPRGEVPAYSDLLIHDMGDALADGITMGRAGTEREFRTQPLWGVIAAAPYLHDGRADTLDEAIRWHGGEAQAARDAWVALDDTQRGEVIAFLASLGGAEQRTDGLLAPNQAVPASDEFGGPAAVLAADELARFERGRQIFDRDFSLVGGLGPVFNGDACRACHFDPVIGGSGPIDVNVIRHGTIDAQGNFSAPAIGTIIHRHASATDVRPNEDSAAAANVFEMRQTPAMFGLGLIEQIPDESISSRADPNDADGDGISGRAHQLSDGRLGRFGWKAQVPSLAEFARDAMGAELGISVPVQAGLSFGAESDSDAADDPEISEADLADLVFFMQQLGPPPTVSSDPVAEAQGAMLFESINCSACHTASLDTAAGDAVALFSDLLLHDVAPGDASSGIADGDAGIREFRTPPLWGIDHSAPYMHDGRSATIKEAVLRHDSEARQAKEQFEALSDEQQDALISYLKSI